MYNIIEVVQVNAQIKRIDTDSIYLVSKIDHDTTVVNRDADWDFKCSNGYVRLMQHRTDGFHLFIPVDKYNELKDEWEKENEATRYLSLATSLVRHVVRMLVHLGVLTMPN